MSAEKKNTARRGSLSQVIRIITRVLNTLTEKGERGDSKNPAKNQRTSIH